MRGEGVLEGRGTYLLAIFYSRNMADGRRKVAMARFILISRALLVFRGMG